MAIARVPALTEKPQQQVVRQGMVVDVELQIKTSLFSSGRPATQLRTEAQSSHLTSQPTRYWFCLQWPLLLLSLCFLIMNTYCPTPSYSLDKVAASHVNVSDRQMSDIRVWPTNQVRPGHVMSVRDNKVGQEYELQRTYMKISTPRLRITVVRSGQQWGVNVYL